MKPEFEFSKAVTSNSRMMGVIELLYSEDEKMQAVGLQALYTAYTLARVFGQKATAAGIKDALETIATKSQSAVAKVAAMFALHKMGYGELLADYLSSSED
jgi:hypothetical protein